MYYFLYLAFDAYTYTSQKWFMRIGFRALRKISLWCTLATYIYNTRARRDILFKVSVFKTLLYSPPPSAMLASVIYEDKTRFLSIIYTRARVQMLTAYVCVHARVRSLVYIRVRSAALRDKYLYEYLNLEWRRARARERESISVPSLSVSIVCFDFASALYRYTNIFSELFITERRRSCVHIYIRERLLLYFLFSIRLFRVVWFVRYIGAKCRVSEWKISTSRLFLWPRCIISCIYNRNYSYILTSGVKSIYRSLIRKFCTLRDIHQFIFLNNPV